MTRRQRPDWRGPRNLSPENPHIPTTLTAAAWEVDKAIALLFDAMCHALRVDRVLARLARRLN